MCVWGGLAEGKVVGVGVGNHALVAVVEKVVVKPNVHSAVKPLHASLLVM